MTVRRIASVLVLTAALPVAGGARAEPWIVSIGARVQAGPPYEGADHDVIFPVATFRARKANDPMRPTFPDDSPGTAIFTSGAISIGPVLGIRGKRDDSGDRTGLRTVDLALEPGVFVNVWPAEWLRFRVEVRKGIRGHHGWIGDAGFDVVGHSGRWTGTLGPRLGLGDSRYMDAYFGVTPQEALANPTISSAYSPSGGIRSGGLIGTLTYRVSPHWETVANAGVRRLAAEAADSPIVQSLGARTTYGAGVGARYTFMWGR